MNIWIFNHYAITPNLPGGTRHFDFGKELAKRGYKVTIFASSFHHALLKETKEYKKDRFIVEDYEGVRFVWLKTFPYSGNDWRRVINMFSYSVSAYKVGRKLNIEKPDIIIGSSVHLFAVYIAYLLSKHFRVPFIMEVRDLWPQALIDIGDISKWHPFVILLGILERFLYKKAVKIITLLPKSHEYIERFGISKDKIVWISNGVDLDRFYFDDLPHWDKDKFDFVVTYLGTFGKSNNLMTAVEAAKILQKYYPFIKFLLVGDGTEKSKLREAIDAENLVNIEIKGSVPKNCVKNILFSSDILYLPVRNSPLFKYGISTNKLFDYLAVGKPIIFASNSPNNPVKEANAGVTISPDTPEQLADAIVKIYKMPKEKRIEMGLNGRKHVEKYYNIPILVDRLEELIKEVSIYEK
jgi:glycosyltransferase involved in cell wall biosynthesis